MVGLGGAPSKLQYLVLALDAAASMLGESDQTIVKLQQLVAQRTQPGIPQAARVLTQCFHHKSLPGGIAFERLAPLALLDKRLDRARLCQQAREQHGRRITLESNDHASSAMWRAR